jgi:RNA polymerase sigma-70 factor (ECF subfamily)
MRICASTGDHQAIRDCSGSDSRSLVRAAPELSSELRTKIRAASVRSAARPSTRLRGGSGPQGADELPEWSEIVAEHGDAVWRTVFRILGHDADAHDCYQETFLAAVRFGSAQAPQDWSRFLIAVATRRAIDRLRHRIRSRSRLASLQAVGEVAARASPAAECDAGELLDQVRQALTELPQAPAEAFWLASVEGLSHAQIAHQLEIEVNYVGVLVHRARSRLKELLADAAPNRRNS